MQLFLLLLSLSFNLLFLLLLFFSLGFFLSLLLLSWPDSSNTGNSSSGNVRSSWESSSSVSNWWSPGSSWRGVSNGGSSDSSSWGSGNSSCWSSDDSGWSGVSELGSVWGPVGWWVDGWSSWIVHCFFCIWLLYSLEDHVFILSGLGYFFRYFR